MSNYARRLSLCPMSCELFLFFHLTPQSLVLFMDSIYLCFALIPFLFYWPDSSFIYIFSAQFAFFLLVIYHSCSARIHEVLFFRICDSDWGAECIQTGVEEKIGLLIYWLDALDIYDHFSTQGHSLFSLEQGPLLHVSTCVCCLVQQFSSRHFKPALWRFNSNYRQQSNMLDM